MRHATPRALLALLALVFLWQWAITIGQPRDFGVYWTAGARILDGLPIYDPTDNPTLAFKYAPIIAYLFAPLSMLPLEVARSAWFAANFALTLALPLLAFDLVGEGRHRFWGVCAAALALALRYVTMNATSGQVVALQLVLALGGLALMRRGHSWGGGLLLSLAIMVKIVPVLFLGYVALRRDWRGIAATLLGCAIWALLPALWFGLAGDARLHLDWLQFIQDANNLRELTRSQNQSLIALGTRIAVARGVPLGVIVPLYGPILFGGFGLLMAWLWRWPEEHHGLALVAIVTYATAIGPLSWRYGLLSTVVAWVYVLSRRPDRRVWTMVGVSVACGLLTARDIIGRPAETWTHLAGIEMWGGILALVACFYATKSSSTGAPAPRNRNMLATS